MQQLALIDLNFCLYSVSNSSIILEKFNSLFEIHYSDALLS